MRSGRGSDKTPGEFRRSQNWIGGARPDNAAYVPPPHAEVADSMGALGAFLHVEGDGLPLLLLAAVAHVQFETIHPFMDGNGRTGRLLITFLLCQAGMLRDPVLYRIVSAPHHRTGDSWPIYPTYDFGHGQSDSIEGVTHSICTAEFEDHRPLYDWLLESLGVYHPQQIEFARLNVSHVTVSKRRLRALVEQGRVSGWDDPRMPTIAAMRRRGYTPGAIRRFVESVGVGKRT